MTVSLSLHYQFSYQSVSLVPYILIIPQISEFVKPFFIFFLALPSLRRRRSLFGFDFSQSSVLSIPQIFYFVKRF